MRLDDTILIDATPDRVWQATVDVERWPEWMPTVTRATRLDSGPFAVGSRARIKQPGLPEAEWVVTTLAAGERFTRETRVRGMHMVATHELYALERGTQSVLRVEITGLMARLLWPIIRGSARRSLARENAALKARCEAERL